MTKKTKKTAVKKDKHPFSGFVNFYLTKTDKEAIKAMPEGDHQMFAWTWEQIEAGYAFKFAWDDYSECPTVMMIGERTERYNQGKIMSARHTDLCVALCVLKYQHEVLSQSEEWEVELPDGDKFNW